MKQLLQNLLEQARASSAGVRIAVGVALALFVGFAGFTAYRASNPHYEVLYGNLDANDAAQMTSALAGANIRFQLSQPPAPHVLYVESGRNAEAQNAIALSGANVKSPTGIQTNAKDSSVFDGANERFQKSMKREWEEMEKQLELLEFVVAASVTTSIPDRSPFRRDRPQTVAVTLTLRGGEVLTKRQSDTVAKLVRFRFDVPRENVIVSDQSGHSLYDGSELADSGNVDDLFENRERFERGLQEKANRILDQVLGEGLAYVVVNSEWTYEQTETIKKSYDPTSKVVVERDMSKTKTPVSSGPVGGAPGTASNLPGDFGVNNAGVPSLNSSATQVQGEASTSDESTTTIVGEETQHRLSHVPLLKSLSVSLFLDESQGGRKDDLQKSVQAAVGFDEARGDSFAAFVSPFASVQRDDEGKVVLPVAPPPAEEPSQIMELILERGVEIVAALGFLFVLLKSLKNGGAKKREELEAAAAAAEAAEEELDEVDLERLAVAQVEELVRTDPEKVAEILSTWALEDLEQKVGS